MSATGMRPEQRLVEQAGGRPVHLEDPEMHQDYSPLRAEVYVRVRDMIEPRSRTDEVIHVPGDGRESKEAFSRNLPELLQDRRCQPVLAEPMPLTRVHCHH
jgi:hypothetical protein